MLRNRILESYYNEIACDKDAAGYLNSQKKSYPKKFLFKVGKVINFSQLKYKIFFSCCLLYEKVWWLLYVYIVARFVLSNFIKPRRSDFLEKALNIGFTESKKTSYDFSLTGISPILEVGLTYRNLASYCTLKDKCSALSLAFSVIYGVQSSKKETSKANFVCGLS